VGKSSHGRNSSTRPHHPRIRLTTHPNRKSSDLARWEEKPGLSKDCQLVMFYLAIKNRIQESRRLQTDLFVAGPWEVVTGFSLGNQQRKRSGQFLVIDEPHWSAEASHTIHNKSWEIRDRHMTQKSNDAGLVGKVDTVHVV